MLAYEKSIIKIILTIYGTFGNAGSRSHATGEGLSISACFPSEYATIVRMVGRAAAPPRRSLQRTPRHSLSAELLTDAIQLTQKTVTVTPAIRYLVTRTNLSRLVVRRARECGPRAEPARMRSGRVTIADCPRQLIAYQQCVPCG